MGEEDGIGQTLMSNPRTLYMDYWNGLAVYSSDMQRERLNRGLFYLHWMLPSEMPNALNI